MQLTCRFSGSSAAGAGRDPAACPYKKCLSSGNRFILSLKDRHYKFCCIILFSCRFSLLRQALPSLHTIRNHHTRYASVHPPLRTFSMFSALRRPFSFHSFIYGGIPGDPRKNIFSCAQLRAFFSALSSSAGIICVNLP